MARRRAPRQCVRGQLRPRHRDVDQGVHHGDAGGAGVVSGAIVGAFVLGFCEALGYAYIPGSTTYLLIFLGLIIFLVVRPQGIMGKPWG